MKLKEFLNEEVDEKSAKYYRGVSKSEAERWMKGEKIPSKDLMPLDWEVCEYGIGDDIKDMSREDIEKWVGDICPWYNGSINSIKNGMNMTSDFDNAKGYGDYVLGINTWGEVADFSDAHHFLKDVNIAELVFIYDVKKDKFIEVK